MREPRGPLRHTVLRCVWLAPAPTRFDIRQFVLVTSVEPLVVWFYDACYMRIASHPYSLAPDRLHDKFAHLCNFSVQRQASSFSKRAGQGQGGGGGGKASRAAGVGAEPEADDTGGSGGGAEDGSRGSHPRVGAGADGSLPMEGNVCSQSDFIRMLEQQHGTVRGQQLWHDKIKPAMMELCVGDDAWCFACAAEEGGAGGEERGSSLATFFL